MDAENLQQELEELKQLIREAETLEDLNNLHHKVGPSEEEAQLAAERMKRVDALDEKCSWDKFESQCSLDELEARQRWHSIMDEQGFFESKYC